MEGSLETLVRHRADHVAQAVGILSSVLVRALATFKYCQTRMEPHLRRVREGEHGNGSAVVAIVLLIIIVIVGFLVWLYTEPTWWESLLGKTRWDKLMDILGG